MRLIHKRDIIRGVRARWLIDYRDWKDTKLCTWCNRTVGDIKKALADLDLETCSEEEVDKALGTKGWATNECDNCGQNVQTLAHFGDEPGYDARWQNLCIDCLKGGYEGLLNTPPVP